MRRSILPKSASDVRSPRFRRRLGLALAAAAFATVGCSTLDIESAGPVELASVDTDDVSSSTTEAASNTALETVVAGTETDLAMVDGGDGADGGDESAGSIAPRAGELSESSNVTSDDSIIVGDADAESIAAAIAADGIDVGGDGEDANGEGEGESDDTSQQSTTGEADASGDGTLGADGQEGQPAVITTGTWTPAEPNVGVRIRSAPAGDILGYIVQGDIARTTGRGRVVNNIEWGEVSLANGSTGWVAVAFLVAAEDPALNPQPTATPAATATPVPAATATAVPAPAATATSVPALATATAIPATNSGATPVLVSDATSPAFASDVPGGLVVYRDYNDPASATGDLIPGGTQLQILSSQAWRVNGVAYVQVSVNGVTGWVDGSRLYTEG